MASTVSFKLQKEFFPLLLSYVSCYNSPNNAVLEDLLIWQINNSNSYIWQRANFAPA